MLKLRFIYILENSLSSEVLMVTTVSLKNSSLLAGLISIFKRNQTKTLYQSVSKYKTKQLQLLKLVIYVHNPLIKVN